ncbi:MAG: hypothetical protein QM811_06935 [Pirellulales bacterium]
MNYVAINRWLLDELDAVIRARHVHWPLDTPIAFLPRALRLIKNLRSEYLDAVHRANLPNSEAADIARRQVKVHEADIFALVRGSDA